MASSPFPVTLIVRFDQEHMEIEIEALAAEKLSKRSKISWHAKQSACSADS